VLLDEVKITMKSEGGNGANRNEGWSGGQAGDASVDVLVVVLMMVLVVLMMVVCCTAGLHDWVCSAGFLCRVSSRDTP